VEHEVRLAVGAQRIKRIARITRQDEVGLIGQHAGLADDPSHGIGNQARAGGESAEGEEGAAFHKDKDEA